METTASLTSTTSTIAAAGHPWATRTWYIYYIKLYYIKFTKLNSNGAVGSTLVYLIFFIFV